MAKLFKLEPKTAALSPARENLRNLLAQREAFQRRIASLRTAEQRLVETLNEAVRANQALADFDAESAAEVLAWSKNSLGKNDASQVDTARRQELLIAKALAAENATAANSAKIQLAVDINAESRASQSLTPVIDEAVAAIIAESTGPLIEDLRESVRLVVAKQNLLKQALQVVISIAHSGDAAVMRPTFVLMEELAERLRTAAVPNVESTDADRAAWESLAVRLRTDPLAELEI